MFFSFILINTFGLTNGPSATASSGVRAINCGTEKGGWIVASYNTQWVVRRLICGEVEFFFGGYTHITRVMRRWIES